MAHLSLFWPVQLDIGELVKTFVGFLGKELTVRGTRPDGSRLEFRATVRIDTPQELVYYRHGGILEYVLRQLRGSEA